MRKIIVSEFVTIDGVMEAPGGEKSLGNRSGWTFPYSSDEQMKFKYDELFSCDALLLGRVTYEGFAAAWPTIQGTGEFGERMNSIPKYVVSTTLEKLEWNNSHLIEGDVVAGIRKLKDEPGKDILVYGSAQLTQTLLENDLADEYRLMIFPVVLGMGKHLFREESFKKNFQLADNKTFPKGVIVTTYQLEK